MSDMSDTVSPTNQDKQFIDLIHSNISSIPSQVENNEAAKANSLHSTSHIDNLLLDEEAEFISFDPGHREKLSDDKVDPFSMKPETKIEDLLLKDEADLMEFINSRPKNNEDDRRHAKGDLPSTSSEMKKENSFQEDTKLISIDSNVRSGGGDVVSSAKVKNKEIHEDVELISIDSDDENEEDHTVENKIPGSSEIKKVDWLHENDSKVPDVKEPLATTPSRSEIPLNELSSSVAGNVPENVSKVDEEVENDEALFIDVDEDDDVGEVEKDTSSPKAVHEAVKNKELSSNEVEEEVKDDEALFIEVDEDGEKDELSLKIVDEVLSSEEDKDVKEDEFLVVDEDGEKDQRSLEKVDEDGKIEEIPLKEVDEDGKMEEIPLKEVDEDDKEDESLSRKVDEGVERDEDLPLPGVDNVIQRNELIVSGVDEVQKCASSFSGQGSLSTDNQNHSDEPRILSNSSNSEAPRPELQDAGVSNPVVENLNMTNDSSNSESPRLRIRLPKKNWRTISPNSSLLESEPLVKRRASLRSRERSSSYVDTSNDDGIEEAFRSDKHYSGSVSDDVLDSDMQDIETAPARHPRNPYGRKGDPNKKKNKKHGRLRR